MIAIGRKISDALGRSPFFRGRREEYDIAFATDRLREAMEGVGIEKSDIGWNPLDPKKLTIEINKQDDAALLAAMASWFLKPARSPDPRGFVVYELKLPSPAELRRHFSAFAILPDVGHYAASLKKEHADQQQALAEISEPLAKWQSYFVEHNLLPPSIEIALTAGAPLPSLQQILAHPFVSSQAGHYQGDRPLQSVGNIFAGVTPPQLSLRGFHSEAAARHFAEQVLGLSRHAVKIASETRQEVVRKIGNEYQPASQKTEFHLVLSAASIQNQNWQQRFAAVAAYHKHYGRNQKAIMNLRQILAPIAPTNWQTTTKNYAEKLHLPLESLGLSTETATKIEEFWNDLQNLYLQLENAMTTEKADAQQNLAAAEASTLALGLPVPAALFRKLGLAALLAEMGDDGTKDQIRINLQKAMALRTALKLAFDDVVLTRDGAEITITPQKGFGFAPLAEFLSPLWLDHLAGLNQGERFRLEENEYRLHIRRELEGGLNGDQRTQKAAETIAEKLTRQGIAVNTVSGQDDGNLHITLVVKDSDLKSQAPYLLRRSLPEFPSERLAFPTLWRRSAVLHETQKPRYDLRKKVQAASLPNDEETFETMLFLLQHRFDDSLTYDARHRQKHLSVAAFQRDDVIDFLTTELHQPFMRKAGGFFWESSTISNTLVINQIKHPDLIHAKALLLLLNHMMDAKLDRKNIAWEMEVSEKGKINLTATCPEKDEDLAALKTQLAVLGVAVNATPHGEGSSLLLENPAAFSISTLRHDLGLMKASSTAPVSFLRMPPAALSDQKIGGGEATIPDLHAQTTIPAAARGGPPLPDKAATETYRNPGEAAMDAARHVEEERGVAPVGENDDDEITIADAMAAAEASASLGQMAAASLRKKAAAETGEMPAMGNVGNAAEEATLVDVADAKGGEEITLPAGSWAASTERRIGDLLEGRDLEAAEETLPVIDPTPSVTAAETGPAFPSGSQRFDDPEDRGKGREAAAATIAESASSGGHEIIKERMVESLGDEPSTLQEAETVAPPSTLAATLVDAVAPILEEKAIEAPLHTLPGGQVTFLEEFVLRGAPTEEFAAVISEISDDQNQRTIFEAIAETKQAEIDASFAAWQGAAPLSQQDGFAAWEESFGAEDLSVTEDWGVNHSADFLDRDEAAEAEGLALYDAMIAEEIATEEAEAAVLEVEQEAPSNANVENSVIAELRAAIDELRQQNQSQEERLSLLADELAAEREATRLAAEAQRQKEIDDAFAAREKDVLSKADGFAEWEAQLAYEEERYAVDALVAEAYELAEDLYEEAQLASQTERDIEQFFVAETIARADRLAQDAIRLVAEERTVVASQKPEVISIPVPAPIPAAAPTVTADFSAVKSDLAEAIHQTPLQNNESNHDLEAIYVTAARRVQILNGEDPQTMAEKTDWENLWDQYAPSLKSRINIGFEKGALTLQSKDKDFCEMMEELVGDFHLHQIVAKSEDQTTVRFSSQAAAARITIRGDRQKFLSYVAKKFPGRVKALRNQKLAGKLAEIAMPLAQYQGKALHCEPANGNRILLLTASDAAIEAYKALIQKYDGVDQNPVEFGHHGMMHYMIIKDGHDDFRNYLFAKAPYVFAMLAQEIKQDNDMNNLSAPLSSKAAGRNGHHRNGHHNSNGTGNGTGRGKSRRKVVGAAVAFVAAMIPATLRRR